MRCEERVEDASSGFIKWNETRVFKPIRDETVYENSFEYNE